MGHAGALRLVEPREELPASSFRVGLSGADIAPILDAIRRARGWTGHGAPSSMSSGEVSVMRAAADRAAKLGATAAEKVASGDLVGALEDLELAIDEERRFGPPGMYWDARLRVVDLLCRLARY